MGRICVYTSFEDFGTMQKILEEKSIEYHKCRLFKDSPTTLTELTEEQEEIASTKIIESIEEDEDVNQIFTNRPKACGFGQPT